MRATASRTVGLPLASNLHHSPHWHRPVELGLARERTTLGLGPVSRAGLTSVLASISVVSCVTGPAVVIDTSGLALSESPPLAPILSSRSSMASCASPCSPSSSSGCDTEAHCAAFSSPNLSNPAQWRRRRDTPGQLCHLLSVLGIQACEMLCMSGLLLGGVPLDFLEKVVLSCEQRREAILNGLCESSRQLRSREASAEPSGDPCQKRPKHASTRKIRPVPTGTTRYATPAQVAAFARRPKHDERRPIRRLQDQKRVNRRDLAAGCQERAAECYARTKRRHCPRTPGRSDRRNPPDDHVNHPADKVGNAPHPRRRRAAPAEP